jgi:hypothetical protein
MGRSVHSLNQQISGEKEARELEKVKEKQVFECLSKKTNIY